MGRVPLIRSWAASRARMGPHDRRSRESTLRCAIALVLAGCVYDSSERCDEGQVLFEDQRCLCADGLVLSVNGCVACGEHEVAGQNGCVCETGYARPSEQAPCEPEAAGRGDACAADMPCPEAAYPHCELGAGQSGYCTTECTSAADCSGGYACNLEASPSICERPPVGAGLACASAAECAGTEATFCDTVITRTCLVQGCSLSPDDCFAGTECCDLTAFAVPQPLCVAAGTCP